MRGHPLLETILLGLLIGALAIPLSIVTRTRVIAATPKESLETKESGREIRADISLRSAHKYTSATLLLGETELALTPDSSDEEISFDPTRVLEIELSVTWPDGTPETAVLVEITPEELETQSHSIWGTGSAYETLCFQWKGETK